MKVDPRINILVNKYVNMFFYIETQTCRTNAELVHSRALFINIKYQYVHYPWKGGKVIQIL